MKKTKETFLNILNKPTMSIEQLAKKYKVPVSVVEKKLIYHRVLKGTTDLKIRIEEC